MKFYFNVYFVGIVNLIVMFEWGECLTLAYSKGTSQVAQW